MEIVRRDPSPDARNAGRRLSLPGIIDDKMQAALAAGQAMAHPRGNVELGMDTPEWYGQVGQKHVYAWGYGEHGQVTRTTLPPSGVGVTVCLTSPYTSPLTSLLLCVQLGHTIARVVSTPKRLESMDDRGITRIAANLRSSNDKVFA